MGKEDLEVITGTGEDKRLKSNLCLSDTGAWGVTRMDNDTGFLGVTRKEGNK